MRSTWTSFGSGAAARSRLESGCSHCVYLSNVYGNDAVELFRACCFNRCFLYGAKVALTLIDVIARSPNLVM